MLVRLEEGAVTRSRREFKLLLCAEEARVLTSALCRYAAAERCQVTSVYFDGPSRTLARRALVAPENCLKVRTKDYFPDLGGAIPRVVVEAKRERNGLVHKDRLWVPRSQLWNLYQRGTLFDELALAEPGVLQPVLAVTYARAVYQQDACWRVTVDREVAFWRVRPEQVLGLSRLNQRSLGTPLHKEPRVVLEVKHLGQGLPRWVAELQGRAARRYSKFAEGVLRLFAGGNAGREA